MVVPERPEVRVHAAMRRLLRLGLGMALVLLTGCNPSITRYVDDGRSYTTDSALAIAESVDPGDLGGAQVSDASELRQRALADLRGQGETAAAAATLITRTFPKETAGVPFYVERITYDSNAAYLVVEAIGHSGGLLEDERVWVLDEAGGILLSGMR